MDSTIFNLKNIVPILTLQPVFNPVTHQCLVMCRINTTHKKPEHYFRKILGQKAAKSISQQKGTAETCYIICGTQKSAGKLRSHLFSLCTDTPPTLPSLIHSNPYCHDLSYSEFHFLTTETLLSRKGRKRLQLPQFHPSSFLIMKNNVLQQLRNPF